MNNTGSPRRSGATRRAILITGFGPFPGVPVNATMRLVPELAELAATVFPGLRIYTEVLATEWTTAPQRLDHLLAEINPGLVLHFGVSPRARGFEIETRACNQRDNSPDAAGVLPLATAINPTGLAHLSANIPVSYLVARLRARGISAFASRDAGQYLCNATLYHSLACGNGMNARRTGFIHIPASLARAGSGIGAPTGRCPLTWEQALDGSLEIVAACIGRSVPRATARLRSVRTGTRI